MWWYRSFRTTGKRSASMARTPTAPWSINPRWKCPGYSELQMVAVRGDVGARHLIGEHQDAVCEVAMEHDGVLLDVDSPQALDALRAPG